LNIADTDGLKHMGLQQLLPHTLELRYPSPSAWVAPDPALAVAAAMAGEACEIVSKLTAKAKEEKEILDRILLSFDRDSAVAIPLIEQLAATQAELDRTQKKAPIAGQAGVVARLEEAQKKANSEHVEKEAIDTRGASRAATRCQADLAAMDAAIAELQTRRGIPVNIYQTSQLAWKTMTALRAEHFASSQASFNDKLASLRATPDDDEDMRDMEMAADLQLQVTASPSDIPSFQLDASSDPQKAAIQSMNVFFSAAPFGTALPAMTFNQVGVQYIPFVKTLVGETVWSKFYSQRTVGEDDYVPFQLLEFLRFALIQLLPQLTSLNLTPTVPEAAEAKKRMDALRIKQQEREAARGRPY
jgi:hypothetical protein